MFRRSATRVSDSAVPQATRPAGDTVSTETNLIRELHWPAQVFSLVMSLGACGDLLASLTARHQAEDHKPAQVVVHGRGARVRIERTYGKTSAASPAEPSRHQPRRPPAGLSS